MKKLSDTKKLDCVTNVRNDSIRHAELVSASQFVILSGAKNLNLPLTLALPHWRGNKVKSALPQGVRGKCVAFTLAETLITLGIIGVVAAITIPTLIQKYQEHVTIVKLKKMYQVVTEAEQRSSIENGEPVTWTEFESDPGKFFEYFSKYYLPYIKAPYKIYNPKQNVSRRVVKTYNLTGAEMSNNVTNNEEVRFADNSCFYFGSNGQFVMLIYDTNCEKKPNVYGKDVWNMFEFKWFNMVERDHRNCKYGCHRAQVPYITSSTVTDAAFEPYCRTSTMAISGAPNRCFAFLFYDGFQFDHKKRNWK